MTKKSPEAELAAIYAKRIKDFQNMRSKRRRRVEGSPKKVSSVLNILFEDNHEAVRRFEEARALFAWQEFVGPAAAEVAKPVRIRNHTLTVRVADPLWLQQLVLLKQEILRKYRSAFPKLRLKDVFFVRG
ncbi:MAG: DUF721 domain-containing protein [Deltaproteobacteria bacterium]|nr:DUF721 domain-containing protein [Deltaproteobacteria bacterium]